MTLLHELAVAVQHKRAEQLDFQTRQLVLGDCRLIGAGAGIPVQGRRVADMTLDLGQQDRAQAELAARLQQPRILGGRAGQQRGQVGLLGDGDRLLQIAAAPAGRGCRSR